MADPDWALLEHAVDANLGDPDFFLRKAIGWALRTHGDRHPDRVLALVEGWQDRISGLSRREALRKLWTQGRGLHLKT